MSFVPGLGALRSELVRESLIEATECRAVALPDPRGLVIE
jgi:hypothetical protein